MTASSGPLNYHLHGNMMHFDMTSLPARAHKQAEWAFGAKCARDACLLIHISISANITVRTDSRDLDIQLFMAAAKNTIYFPIIHPLCSIFSLLLHVNKLRQLRQIGSSCFYFSFAIQKICQTHHGH